MMLLNVSEITPPHFFQYFLYGLLQILDGEGV